MQNKSVIWTYSQHTYFLHNVNFSVDFYDVFWNVVAVKTFNKVSSNLEVKINIKSA